MKTRTSLILLVLLAGTVAPAFGQSADRIGGLYEKLAWRSIGPAVMGGRTVDVEAVESKPWIIYAAVGPSGVWKSVNNGTSWEPSFFKEATVSVGDLAVSPSNPDVVWVGTGEATCRNSVTIGDGVYKSVDAGKTWTRMGLTETRHISRIIVNRGDSNIVYVAAMGHLWGSNADRGVYKTIDGGSTWTKVLYVDDRTGFADLAQDPSDSLTLYAAAYDHRRSPHLYISGGPGSGLYKTSDGGRTWKKLTEGLPGGILGRIGVDVSRSNPQVVYALIEAADPGIWRSEDKGETWKRTAEASVFRQVNSRPFYYSQIRVDPSNDKTIYVLSTGGYVSDNMGKSFRVYAMGTHPDHHALWIDPSNPLHLIDGNDGGIDISYDQGRTWLAVQSIPAAEAYEIGLDLRTPYHVYCGLQDNGSWGGPSASTDPVGIVNNDWYPVGSGDGFYVRPDPSDPMIVYSNSQMNGLTLADLRVFRNRSIRPEAPLDKPPYRYNWNSPILISPHDPKTVYTAGNILFRTRDGGRSWTAVSPDLTTNDPAKLVDSGGPLSPENTGAEIHCTIVTTAESPLVEGLIWCGTDDGNLQLTRDGGRTWTNVVRNIPKLPAGTWCARVEASHFDPGTAYAAFDGHRTDDYGTYVYKTTDFGRTWTSLRANLPFGWAHVIRESSRNRNLLFVGLEFGIWASLDGGRTWFSLRNNLPTVAVHDIAIHPRERDLVIGTHGWGIWILDDITPLEEMSDSVLASGLHLFAPRPAVQFLMSSRSESFGRPLYGGTNPASGMILTVYSRAAPSERPTLRLKSAKGDEAFKISLPIKEGLQRIVWNLESTPRTEKGEPMVGGTFSTLTLPPAIPGEYSVELQAGPLTSVRQTAVLPDPRYDCPEDERQAQNALIVRAMTLSRALGAAVTAVAAARREADAVGKAAEGRKDLSAETAAGLKAFSDKLRVLEADIKPSGIGAAVSRETALRGGPLSLQLMLLSYAVKSFPGAPTETQLRQADQYAAAVADLVRRLNDFIMKDIPALNAILAAGGLKPLTAPARIE